MYRHFLIPTDGSDLAERAVTHGLSLAKFVGAKVTVIIVEERFGGWLYTEQIKEHTATVLDRAANAAKQAGVPCHTIHVQDVQPHEAIIARARTGVAISSSWHRTDAADYPQLCLAV